MRELGYHCGMVERFIPFPKPHGHREDLFGIIDFIAIDECMTIGVQSCGQSFAAHLRKIEESPMTKVWLESVDRELWVIGWRKLLKKRGGKATRWTPRIEIIKR